MTRSIMLLKEKPYRPRMADYRIGVFFTGREQLGEGAKTTAPVYYANRWDIQPSDTAAYLRGEKVKPTKQIVFYIDNTFPEKWKPYLDYVLKEQEWLKEHWIQRCCSSQRFPD
jgi:hypothetical protein